MIVISPYNPHWPDEFEAIRVTIVDALGSLALRIDHIGSTSVPGLGAKDVIDVQITVAEITDEVKRRMIDAGYELGRHTRDHLPEGEAATPVLWQKLIFNEGAGQRRANIHIRKLGNPNQRYPLLFRDYLRAHPKSAMTVERIKRELAKHHGNDVDTYYDIKDPVYDLIWDAAQAWASCTNWQM